MVRDVAAYQGVARGPRSDDSADTGVSCLTAEVALRWNYSVLPWRLDQHLAVDTSL
jgi:hypothetical protein